MANNDFELKVEVVRFNENDVIATSGAGSRIIDVNSDEMLNYVVLRTEFEEYNESNIKTGITGDLLYMEYADAEGQWFADESAYNQYLTDGYRYAWYDNGNWFTDSYSAKYHYDYNYYPR